MRAPFLLLILLLLPGVSVLAVPPAAQDSLQQALAQAPALAELRLSPDGERLAMIRRRGESWQVFSGRVDGEQRPVYQSSLPLTRLYWVSETRLVVEQQPHGSQPRWLAMERNGRASMAITPADWGRSQGPVMIDLLASDPMHVLMAVDERKPWLPDLWRVNVYTGERKRVARNEGQTFSWMTDRFGQPRVRTDFSQVDGRLAYTHFWREEQEGRWRPFHRHVLGEAGLTPLMFDLDNRHLIVSADLEGDTLDLYRLDPRNAGPGDPIYRNSTADITRLRYSGKSRAPAQVSFNAALPGQAFLDRELGRQAEAWAEQLPGLQIRVVSQSSDERRAVLMAWSDRLPGRYYLYDAAQSELQPLDDYMPGIDPSRMQRTIPVSVPARDGLVMGGYLTQPAHLGTRPPPLVIYVHGGPWVRDSWGFDPLVQSLTARGMAVLQVNYRGSRGLGRSLFRAGFRQWGQGMQTDIDDARAWAVQRGLADPERVCLMGHSYGGFATLRGLLDQPQDYRCGVAYAPVSNLVGQMQWFEEQGNQRALYEWEQLVGDRKLDAVMLRELSPQNQVRSLERPLLLAHGMRDAVVAPAQTESLLATAGPARSQIRWLPLEGAAHDLEHQPSRSEFFEQVGAFLEEQLLAD